MAKTVGEARAAFGPRGGCRPRRGRARENPVPGEHGEENEYSEWLAARSPQLDLVLRVMGARGGSHPGGIVRDAVSA